MRWAGRRQSTPRLHPSDSEPASDAYYGERPKTRGDCTPDPLTVGCPTCYALPWRACEGGEVHPARVDEVRAPLRPCPWVSCKYHMLLDVDHDGSITYNAQDADVTSLAATCVLDEAERAGMTLAEVGAMLNITRERIRQIETRALDHSRVPDLHPFLLEDLTPEEQRLLDMRARARAASGGPPPDRVVVIGRCPTCRTQRRRKGDRWVCDC